MAKGREEGVCVWVCVGGGRTEPTLFSAAGQRLSRGGGGREKEERDAETDIFFSPAPFERILSFVSGLFSVPETKVRKPGDRIQRSGSEGRRLEAENKALSAAIVRVRGRGWR
ncbi:unnamed protein product [Pleuronectes platessa]|uniref:Uncharacterized protein n=1 Tax=Pleuronectes platessa TaxID=8262 RepID=A0A9N7U1T8_PLEPL|nr:unnamed protein product [Pleuronectes platessa]